MDNEFCRWSPEFMPLPLPLESGIYSVVVGVWNLFPQLKRNKFRTPNSTPLAISH
jgi:hypothetical protein